MSWEEELRQLDDELAAGRLSATKHRKRRDEILAEASSAQPFARPASGVRVPSAWLPRRANPRAAAPPSWEPVRQQPALMTPTQAHEVFVNGKERGGRGWLVALAIVAVLAVAGGAVWWFGFAEDPAAGPVATSTTQPSAQPGGIDRLELPGTPDDRSGELTVQRALELKVLSSLEANLLQQEGATEVTYRGASDGNYRYLLYAYPSADPGAAQERTAAIARVQEAIGLTEAPVTDLPDGVQAVELRNAKAAVVRGLYTSGSSTVQLVVLQEPASDAAELESQFKHALSLTVDQLPPS